MHTAVYNFNTKSLLITGNQVNMTISIYVLLDENCGVCVSDMSVTGSRTCV